jgi:site-specific DNA-methyltransferase (adenine-specific)
VSVIHGDCLDVMATFDAESIDAIVTDPPYGLEFMGKAWDKLGAGIERTDDTQWAGRTTLPFGGGGQRVRYGKSAQTAQAWHEAWATAALRVAKPGAYLLAFGGTRTVHRMTCAIEDAGWIIRDMLVWAYASGFPKGRANLKPAWEPIVMARKPGPLRPLNIDASRLPAAVGYVQPRATTDEAGASWSKGSHVPFHYADSIGRDASGSNDADSTAYSGLWPTDDPTRDNPNRLLRVWSAARPDDPAYPLANALADAFVGRGVLGSRGGYPSCLRCDDGLARIAEAADREDAPLRPDVPGAPPLREWSVSRIREYQCADHLSTWDELARVVAGEADLSFGNDTTLDIQQGRWPANVILTETPDGGGIFDGGWDGVVGGGETASGDPTGAVRHADNGFLGKVGIGSPLTGYGDSGSYSRFFLIPKAARSDREPVLGGLDFGPPPASARSKPAEGRQDALGRPRGNSHPTVKPTELMRHLVRLVTPPGGIVLDPFLGSGTTALAAEQEGFAWIGIEKEAEYVAIAEARLNGTQKGMAL